MKYLCGTLLLFFGFLTLAQQGNNEKKRLKNAKLPGDITVDIGLNQWSAVPRGLELKNWASKSAGIYYTQRFPLLEKLYFNAGIGIGMEKIGFDSPITLLDTGLVYIDTLSSTGLKKNKLAMTYIDVPIELRFYPMGTEEGEGLFVAIGGMVGLKLNAHTKYRYKNDKDASKQKNHADFNLNSIRYGYQVRVGFKGVNVFFREYLSGTFNDEVGIADGDGRGLTNPEMRTFGISFTGF